MPTSNDNEQTILNNIDKSHKRSAEWNKPNTKKYTVYDSIT